MNAYNTLLFYRGDYDDNITTADNGALLNSDYERIMSTGPWGEVRLHKVCEGVHTVTGFSVNNYTFIESDNGYILIDTGFNQGSGRQVLEWKRQLGDKPIVAIIYSHEHYTGGTRPIVEAHPERDIPIYAHPALEDTLFVASGPAALSQALVRGMGQMGSELPPSGQDAAAIYAFRLRGFDDPASNVTGSMAPTYSVSDGEEILIDGVRVVFYHALADSPASLICSFPEYDLVVHNAAIMPIMFPIYTTRGGSFRDPVALIAGIDKIRRLKPTHMIGCHGFPVSGKDKVYELTTLHRDAYAYLWQQTLRGIERGLGPNELVQEVRWPKHFNENEALFPAYIDVEYVVRGIYGGIIGWWANDASDLHPPTPEEFGSAIVAGFGGPDKLIDRALTALGEKKYNLVAKLMSTLLAAEPDNARARQVKADALRKMAQTTRSGIQSRNFFLREALRLENKLSVTPQPDATSLVTRWISKSMAMEAPPARLIKLMENHIEPAASLDLRAIVKFSITDRGHHCGMAIRRGVAEFIANGPVAPDVAVTLDHDTLTDIAIGKLTVEGAVKEGRATIEGSPAVIKAVYAAFPKVLGNSGSQSTEEYRDGKRLWR